ncbi:hypothetical protein [Gordonia sp. p3-SID1431]|uniref:hypothetical protein n=1 Tax=Gordonia sp. p3-SID1431 TaxID=2916159 RepID=UPI0021A2ACFE|nr:hypothetical protein [Gordonia sp. p3-SID1431]MCT1355217.1 hypothetical protein [Gordonia sp. p3-SID1431]
MLSFQAFRVLHWLDKAAPGGFPPAEVCPDEDLDGVHDELHELGYIEDREIGGITFIPTSKGRVAARRIRAEYRHEVARRAVLGYLNEHADDYVGFEGLEHTAWADDPDGRLTADEISEAINDLDDRGLIEGPQRTAGGKLPHAMITSAGRTAFRRGVSAEVVSGGPSATAPQPHYSTTTTITGDNNQVAAGTRGPVTQHLSIVDNSTTVTAGYEDIAQLVRDLVEQRLPLLGLKDDDQQDVIDEARVVLGEVVKDEPDHKIIRRALTTMRGVLASVFAGVNQAVADESAEVARTVFDQIGASGFL